MLHLEGLTGGVGLQLEAACDTPAVHPMTKVLVFPLEPTREAAYELSEGKRLVGRKSDVWTGMSARPSEDRVGGMKIWHKYGFEDRRVRFGIV